MDDDEDVEADLPHKKSRVVQRSPLTITGGQAQISDASPQRDRRRFASCAPCDRRFGGGRRRSIRGVGLWSGLHPQLPPRWLLKPTHSSEISCNPGNCLQAWHCWVSQLPLEACDVWVALLDHGQAVGPTALVGWPAFANGTANISTPQRHWQRADVPRFITPIHEVGVQNGTQALHHFLVVPPGEPFHCLLVNTPQ